MAAFLLLASPAAADNFASPNGSGTDCTAASPCSVATAVSTATSTEDVNIRGDLGDYTITGDVHATNPVHVKGINGRPRLLFDPGGLFLDPAGSSAENIYVESSSADFAFALTFGGTADNVIVRATADEATACFGRDLTITNSVCFAPGADSIGLFLPASDPTSSTSVARNVTAWAPGLRGRGVRAYANGGETSAVTLSNVIAKGGTGGGDLVSEADTGSTASITTDHTRHDQATDDAIGAGAATIAPDASDISALPLFLDALHGDFHQRCGSPTLEAGINSASNGLHDFDGENRTLITNTDIGADELAAIAPAAQTGAATGATFGSAIVGGTINPRACLTKWHVKYGTTTAYGQRTPDRTLPAGIVTKSVSEVLHKLKPQTTYHFRLFASSAQGGPESGNDLTFVTGAFPGAAVLSTKAKVGKDRIAKIKLACPAETTGSCDGKLALTRKKNGKVQSVARAVTFSVKPGKTGKVAVTIRKNRMGLLAKPGGLVVTAKANAHDGLGNARKTSGKVTLTPK